MKVEINPARETWNALCQRPQLELEYLEGVVNNILTRVKISGDDALRELTKQFDGIALTNLAATAEEVNQAIASLPESLKQSITQAAANIENFILRNAPLSCKSKRCRALPAGASKWPYNVWAFTSREVLRLCSLQF